MLRKSIAETEVAHGRELEDGSAATTAWNQSKMPKSGTRRDQTFILPVGVPSDTDGGSGRVAEASAPACDALNP